MSFIVRCPFCKSEMDAPDEALGLVAQCTTCGREIDLEPADVVPDVPARVPDDPAAQQARMMRAASITATMPRVTWSWEFDTVWKISIAIMLIDGFLGLIIYLIRAFLGQSSKSNYHF